MPRKFIRKYMPDHDKIRNHVQLNRIFGTLLHDPNLLHLNRRSVSSAFAVGLFMAFVPVPFQMLLAAAAAIIVRCNLAIAVALVWLTNPVTMGPIFFFCYKVGTWFLGTPVRAVEFAPSWEWFSSELGIIWQPLLLGCFVVGAITAALGYGLVRLLWRLHLLSHIRNRQLQFALRRRENHKHRDR
ncbi:MAG: DUF2062 domain-containing protein [Pseudomonadota bacterium]|nr:DUF2062 domain-containing protein [Pseudomonadota bacterium]